MSRGCIESGKLPYGSEKDSTEVVIYIQLRNTTDDTGVINSHKKTREAYIR